MLLRVEAGLAKVSVILSDGDTHVAVAHVAGAREGGVEKGRDRLR